MLINNRSRSRSQIRMGILDVKYKHSWHHQCQAKIHNYHMIIYDGAGGNPALIIPTTVMIKRRFRLSGCYVFYCFQQIAIVLQKSIFWNFFSVQCSLAQVWKQRSVTESGLPISAHTHGFTHMQCKAIKNWSHISMKTDTKVVNMRWYHEHHTP